MINIAICDDDEAMTGEVERMLGRLGGKQNIMLNCDVYFDGATLVESIRCGAYYDLIYLDIEMQHMNGIRAAQIIRSMDSPALIVFVSGYEKYLRELFSAEPFRFVYKPIEADIFDKVFRDAYARIRRKRAFFSYAYNKVQTKLPLKTITYFESRNRVVLIHRAESSPSGSYGTEDRFYGKINDVEKQLSDSDSRFIRIHQSYLVNFDYIRRMDFDAVHMMDGTILKISEDRHKKARSLFCFLAGSQSTGA